LLYFVRFHTGDKKVVGVFVRFRAPLQLYQRRCRHFTGISTGH
jgi:hypothetical protein